MSLLSAARTGWDAFLAAYTGKNLIPRDNNGFESEDARLSRYPTLASYADNEMYTSANPQFANRKMQNRLYSNIRAVMNVCPRVVDLFVYFVYVGSIDMDSMTGGAIPLATDDEGIKDAVRQVFKWSNWNMHKDLYVRNGATFGDSAIKIVDDREKQKVYMEPLDPSRIKDVELDSRGNVTSVVIEYKRDEEPDLGNVAPGQLKNVARKTYKYTEIITKTHIDKNGEKVMGQFRTFKDDKPFAYFADMNGNLVTEWDNEYGFVPVVLVQHTSTGLKWGANSFYKILRKIDELNDVTSLLHDQIRKVIVPLLAAIGITKKKSANDTANGVDLEVNSTGRDTVNIVYLPKDTELRPVTTDIDIGSVTANNKSLSDEIVNDVPILALQQIRGMGGDMTQPGIEAAYSDAKASVNSARANYDHGMVRALQMCISIGGYNGYEGFEGYNLDSYDNGELDFAIANRPVISVGISTDRKVELLASISKMNAALQEVALAELDFPQEKIDKVVAATEQGVRLAARGFGQAVFNDDFEDDEGEPAQVGAGQQQGLLPAMAGAGV